MLECSLNETHKFLREHNSLEDSPIYQLLETGIYVQTVCKQFSKEMSAIHRTDWFPNNIVQPGTCCPEWDPAHVEDLYTLSSDWIPGRGLRNGTDRFFCVQISNTFLVHIKV